MARFSDNMQNDVVTQCCQFLLALRAAIWIMLTRLLISRPQQRDPAFLPRRRSVGFFIDFPQSPMSLPHSTENVDIAVARGFECSPLGELRDFGLGHTLLDDRCAGPIT
jgi:hypothetical protein